MTRNFRFGLPALLWFFISTILLTLPGSAFPTRSWMDNIPLMDKWIHVGLFAVLVWLGCWAIYKIKPLASSNHLRWFINTCIWAIAYGIIMEFVQKYWIPFRSFDIGDIAADAIGSIAGFIFSRGRYIKK